MTPTLDHARRLWDYLSTPRTHAASDAIVVCGSYDLRICDYACDLLKRGVAPRLLLSGNCGHWTNHLWDAPEAHVFRDRALANGVDPARIIVEDRATNTGDNISFARALLPAARRVTFIAKPNSVARVRLTVPVRWPSVEFWVDAPAINFPTEVSNAVGILGAIHEMVGDIQRIVEYPRRGLQVPEPLPAEVH